MKIVYLTILGFLLFGCDSTQVNSKEKSNSDETIKVTKDLKSNKEVKKEEGWSHWVFYEINRFEHGGLNIHLGMSKEKVIKILPKEIRTYENTLDFRDVLTVPDEETQKKNIWQLKYGTQSAFGDSGSIKITFEENKVVKLEDRYESYP